MKRPRILLAADHPEMLEALRAIVDELGEGVGMVTGEILRLRHL